MDDVVVFSKSLHDHIVHLTKIFEKFRQFNLKMQIDKSEFLRKEVAFLGHIITPIGIMLNPSLQKLKPLRNILSHGQLKKLNHFWAL